MTSEPSRPAPMRAAPSQRLYDTVRAQIMHGAFPPGSALKPAEIAEAAAVSLAVAREALLRLVGEGLAVRLHNRGFAVPEMGADRWQKIAEARVITEPAILRLSIARGDVDWEVRVRAAHHRLVRTPVLDRGGMSFSDEWEEAHRLFHRALLEGSRNDILLDGFDRTWVASELARRWSGTAIPRDAAAEHAALEEAALARDVDRACELLVAHLTLTAQILTEARADVEGKRA